MHTFSSQKNRFKKLTFVPSWFILIIDVFITIIISLATFFTFKLIGVKFHDTISVFYRFIIFNGTLIFFYLLFKTYKGVIRYSTYRDAVRFFQAIAFSFLQVALIDTIFYLITNKHLFVIMTIFFSSLAIFISLVIFRLIVKVLFRYFTVNETNNKIDDIVIIGVSRTTISIAESFVNDNSHFKLQFFIDKDKKLNKKKILGVPVLAKTNSISSILRHYDIKNIILIKDFLTANEEEELINYCLNNKVNVYNPQLSKGVENKSNTKNKLKKYTIDQLMFRDSITIQNPKVIETFESKTIFVTGGAGSIGSEIVNQLSSLNPSCIVVLDQAETPLNSLQLTISSAFPNINCHFELVDITNKSDIYYLFEKYKPVIVFHAAAYKHVPVLESNFMQAVRVNIFGTKNILQAALEFKAERFVFISTDKAVNPTNIMGASKRISEIMVQSYFHKQQALNKTQIITTRFGNVLGSNGSVVNLFNQQIEQGGPITVTHPEINRFFMTIPEACRLVLEAGAMGAGGEIFIFDMGKPIFIKDLAEKMIRLSGKEPYKDIDIVYTGLRPGEKLYEEVLADSSKTLPTYHSKILIAQDPVYSFQKVEDFLVKLKSNNYQDKDSLISSFMELVPEFIRNNNVNS